MNTQHDLQQEILTATGMNLVTCGNCGVTIIHTKNQEVIVCSDCGTIGEPCDFPDLNYVRDSSRPELYEYAQKQELVLEDIFLNDDINEENPVQVYCSSFHKSISSKELIILYSVSEKTYEVRIWKLNDIQNVIAEKHRYEILKSRLAKITAEDEVSVGDIFMHGEHTTEININEWKELVAKHWK